MFVYFCHDFRLKNHNSDPSLFFFTWSTNKVCHLTPQVLLASQTQDPRLGVMEGRALPGPQPARLNKKQTHFFLIFLQVFLNVVFNYVQLIQTYTVEVCKNESNSCQFLAYRFFLQNAWEQKIDSLKFWCLEPASKRPHTVRPELAKSKGRALTLFDVQSVKLSLLGQGC